MDKNTIKVLVVEPKGKPYIKEIPDTLESKQEIVGGNIEAIYPFEDPVCLVCNEEGKINNLEFNRVIFFENAVGMDIIQGTFFICGLTEDDFGSLSDDLIEKYEKKFHSPQKLINIGNTTYILNYSIESKKDNHKKDAPER